ncbi:DUF4244 domain-containing protein [Streptomyces paromomycinus]
MTARHRPEPHRFTDDRSDFKGEEMSVRRWLERRVAVVRERACADRGMTTAEYALGTLAACAAAAVLYKVLSGGAVEAALRAVIGKALGVQV